MTDPYGAVALRCAIAIVVVTVLFLLVAGFLAYPIAPITTAFVGGVWDPPVIALLWGRRRKHRGQRVS